MHIHPEPVAINARRIVAEVLWFVAQMLVLGIGVAVAVAVPVIVWALTR